MIKAASSNVLLMIVLRKGKEDRKSRIEENGNSISRDADDLEFKSTSRIENLSIYINPVLLDSITWERMEILGVFASSVHLSSFHDCQLQLARLALQCLHAFVSYVKVNLLDIARGW